MSEPLKAIETRIFQSRGVLYEADIFSILFHSPFILRSFEFGLADGGLDCSNSYRQGASFADRFWDAHDRRYAPGEASEILPFEAKNTVAEQAGHQVFITTTRQRKLVAFFIAMSAADPTFVEVIPNLFQEEAALEHDAIDGTYSDPHGEREVAVNISRVNPLPPHTYRGLDQCGGPYRMPIWLLPEAMARIRRRVTHGEIYINPWTEVRFDSWDPKTTQAMEHMEPADHTDQASAYRAVMETYRLIKHRSNMGLDFVGSQPRLADFSLSVDGRLVFIQHKLDPTLRSATNVLEKVPIARGEGTKRKHFFSAFDRFDFLWYQFNFAHAIEEVFYFIPERELPDSFYNGRDKFGDFSDINNVAAYRVVMDPQGQWLEHIERIVREHPHPRAPHERPVRPAEVDSTMSSKSHNTDIQALSAKGAGKQLHGRHEFATAMRRGQRELYYSIMCECAKRMSGLLVVHARNDPSGDMSYMRFTWTADEATAFLRQGTPPLAAHHIPAGAELIPLIYSSQAAECFFQGPNLRPSQFRRLNACSDMRLLVVDIGGADATVRPIMPAIIPSNDIKPSESQIAILTNNATLNKTKSARDNDNPSVSAVLSSGLYCAEYAVGNEGPLLLNDARCGWGAVWELLQRFTSVEVFEHPPGHKRAPALYRHTMRSIQQRLQQQHELNPGEDFSKEEEL